MAKWEEWTRTKGGLRGNHRFLTIAWFMKHLLTILSTISLIAFNTPAAPAPSSITIQLDTTKKPGKPIPITFTGLSFEMSLLRPNENGVRYFRPDNEPLKTLFATLGIFSLRIGGNTSDRDARQLPAREDIDSLFNFARATGITVIYCLRLHNGDPDEDARTVKYIMEHNAPYVDCFSIGQEPSAYPVEKQDARASAERMGAGNEKYSYAAYRDDWKRFADTIIAAEPIVKFCGPSVHNNGTWARNFMQDFGHGHHVALVTEHLYAGGAGGKVPSPEIGRDRMLSDDFARVYQKLYDSFVPMAQSNGLPYRLEEVNNYYNGGATNVSSTFASALWGLDFMYWWAEHGASGVSFHTGDRVAAGNTLLPSKYTAFYSTTNGYVVRPLGYGIKAFDLGADGSFIPATVSNVDNVNLAVYAVGRNNERVDVTLINKEHGPGAREARVRLEAGKLSKRGKIISLTQAAGDVAATNGVTLGGAEIKSDGTWAGDWQMLKPDGPGVFNVTVAPASAVVVEMAW